MAASKLQILANVSQPIRAPAVLLFLFVVFIGCVCKMRFVLVILLCKRIWRYFWTNVQLGTKIFGLTSWVLNNLNRPQRAVSIANTMSIVELILDILSPVIRQFSV